MAFELNRMLKPRSVALIGASADPSSISGLVVRNVLAHFSTAQNDLELAANAPLLQIYLVNPHHTVLYERTCLHDIKSMPMGIDLAIILTPWTATPDCISELSERDIGGVVCISIATESSIIGVLWQSRKHLLAKLRRQLGALGIGFIGPSSFGLQLPHLALNASLIPKLAYAGGLALICHSEAVADVAADYCAAQGLGLRALITLGDAIDINAAELLDYFAKDSQTTTVLLQLPPSAVETAKLKQEFVSALRACAQRKPTIVWLSINDCVGPQNSAQTPLDSSATILSEAQMLQQGAFSVTNLESFCEAAHLKQFVRGRFDTASPSTAFEPRPAARLMLMGNSAALLDLCVQAGQHTVSNAFANAALPVALIRKLRPLLPARSKVANPLDLGRDASPARYVQVATALRAFSDVLIICHHSNAFSDGYAIARAICEDLNQNRYSAEQRQIAIFTGSTHASARALFNAHGIATFNLPATAMRALQMCTQLEEIRAASTRYPFPNQVQTEQSIVSASGISMILRDIQGTDEAELQRGFLRLSADEVRMRFMHPLKALTQELAVRLTQLDSNRDIALVLAAPAPAGEAQIFAVVRASRTPSYQHRMRTDAEFAIVIPRALSGQGLGTKLMLQLIQRCRAAGIHNLWGDVLAENTAMLALTRKLGFKVQKHPDQDFGGGNLVRVVQTI